MKVRRIVSIAIVGSLLLFQPVANAKINRDNLSGGALGIIQCQHSGQETKVIWRLIVTDVDKPIYGINFIFRTNGETRTVFKVTIPARSDYQTVEVFNGVKQEISIFGEAYSLRPSSIYRYYLRKPLNVECD